MEGRSSTAKPPALAQNACDTRGLPSSRSPMTSRPGDLTFELKEYQKKTLSALKFFLDAARVDGAEAAFVVSVSRDSKGQQAPSYRKVTGMEEIPYVCLRLPTGGGKTVLASPSIAIAANAHSARDFPTGLWLGPPPPTRRH